LLLYSLLHNLVNLLLLIWIVYLGSIYDRPAASAYSGLLLAEFSTERRLSLFFELLVDHSQDSLHNEVLMSLCLSLSRLSRFIILKGALRFDNLGLTCIIVTWLCAIGNRVLLRLCIWTSSPGSAASSWINQSVPLLN
jgi:hypothetical protein